MSGIDITDYVRLTPDDLCAEGVQNLTEAIVKKAADDWREAVAARIRGNVVLEHSRMQTDCERFFLSDWFFELTGLNGRVVLQKLKKEAGL